MTHSSSIRRTLIAIVIAVFATLPAMAFGPMASSPQTNTTSSVTSTSQDNATMLESLQIQSEALRHLSEQLQTRSETIDPAQTNSEYLMAMLRLSSDIGIMANRIGEMADRIVYTEELIGTMSDRIVTVSQALLGNNQATQTNILATQHNLSTLIAATRAQ